MQNPIKLYGFGRQLCCVPYIPHTPSYIVVRFYYVNSGSAVVYYSKKEHLLTAGNFYLLPPCTDFHTIQANNFDHTFFDFKTSFMLRSDSFTEISGKRLNIDTFFKFINDSLRNNQLSIATAQHFCAAFMSHLEQNLTLPYLTDTHVQKAMEIILHASADLTVKSIAEKLNLNEAYFIRIFTKTIGISPMKFIRTSLLSEGLHMLKNGMSVTAVSEQCGYSSPNAFWKAFQKEFGYAPSRVKIMPGNEPGADITVPDSNLYRNIHIFSPPEIKTPPKNDL